MMTRRSVGVLEDADLPPQPPFDRAHHDHRDGGGRGDVVSEANDDGNDAAGSDADDRDADDDDEDHGNDAVISEIREEGATGGYGGQEEMQRQSQLNEGEETPATATGMEEEHTGKCTLGQMDAVKWC